MQRRAFLFGIHHSAFGYFFDYTLDRSQRKSQNFQIKPLEKKKLEARTGKKDVGARGER